MAKHDGNDQQEQQQDGQQVGAWAVEQHTERERKRQPAGRRRTSGSAGTHRRETQSKIIMGNLTVAAADENPERIEISE